MTQSNTTHLAIKINRNLKLGSLVTLTILQVWNSHTWLVVTILNNQDVEFHPHRKFYWKRTALKNKTKRKARTKKPKPKVKKKNNFKVRLV